ncbi:mimecan [Phascolarctos cinereus]|uniref:Mimecan n=1 Tax=Phascolarctos cinereus TaxID=38626 RepID=A0A6P5ICV2_PHACI|nr:mimecan [Phascolarctos cinereus]
MKTLQAALLWVLLVPWVKPAPPTPQRSTTEILEEIWDYEEPPQDEKTTKKKDIMAILHALQKDESATEQPARNEDGEMPTCLLCVCLSGSVYCEETNIDAVPPLPKETSYLYARFNKIRKITAKDFADIPNLRRLDFTGNLIEDIEDGAFSRLSLLEELTLAENRLLKLPALPPKLTLLNARHNKLKSKGIKANTFKKLNNLSFLYLDHNELEAVPPHLPESLRILHLQFNNIADITDDTFCKSNDTRYIRSRVDEIRMEGNPILLGKHPNSFICLKRLPTGTYY